MAWHFRIRSFFESYSESFHEYIRLLAVFVSFEIFFHMIYPFGFSVMFFPFHILLQNCLFPLHPVVCLSFCIFQLLCKFSFIILEGPILFVFLDPIPISFESPLFHLIFLFLFLFSSCIVKFVCCLILLFLYQNNLKCFSFLSTFACCRSFLTYHSILFSHPDFVFLFGLLWKMLILSQTSFISRDLTWLEILLLNFS